MTLSSTTPVGPSIKVGLPLRLFHHIPSRSLLREECRASVQKRRGCPTMRHQGCLLFLLLVAGVAAAAAAATPAERVPQLGRSSFPPGFVFGTASAAYQYEGAATEGGRGPSIWDTFTKQHPEKIEDRSSGAVAVDFYHRYKEDVGLMKEMGTDGFRFSISWTRILPTGSLSGGINKAGVAYYNSLINELISKGLKPFVTIFHWDAPQGLEDLYGGFRSTNIIKDYAAYAEVCFREFGDRVKHWITFNEPYSFCTFGYDQGTFAPGRCSPWAGNCSTGDSSREPYAVCHNLLLAHAATVKLYREKFQGSQKGVIGITIVTHWLIPFRPSKADKDAVARALDFMYGWFMDPLTQGDYPFNMRALVGDRLPKFSYEQSKLLKGSYDFIGLNYYATQYALPRPFVSNSANKSYTTDNFATLTGTFEGKSVGPVAASSWFYIYPRGIKDILLYTREKYNNPVIYITENGIDEVNNASLPVAEALKDSFRVSYHQQHLDQLHQAIREGANVKGYFAWSLLDDFEWNGGFTVRFGFHYVDYKNGLKRYPKSSALWFRNFLTR